jgi:hypothetical protein
MHISNLDKVLWAAGFLGHAALLLVLILRHRVRSYPFFSAYILFQIVSTAVLFVDYRLLAARAYPTIYWSGALFDFCLLFAVLAEVALHLLRPLGRWIADSLRTMTWLSVLGIALAVALTFWVHPLHVHSHKEWQMRANLFTSIVTCELFTVILLTAQRFGVYWRSHLMGLGAGLTIWALMCFLVEGMHGYWGAAAHYGTLENARKIAYLNTLVFWMATFWRAEPERESIPPEMRNAILLQTHRLSYDLAEALGTEKEEI